MTIEKIFETYAENAFDISEKESALNWKRECYNVNFKRFFPEDKKAKILDIGPGLGEMLIVEKEWGYTDLYAIDISPSVIQYCRKLNLDCEQVGSTEKWLKNHPNSYDVITLLDVFEHIAQNDTVSFLEACKCALREKGILILQVPNIQSPESFLHRYNDITHVFGYSQHTLEQLFSIVGFKTVKFYPFEEYPGIDKNIKITKRLREIYWKIVNTNREITHNLQPEILTPEIFVILCKQNINLPIFELENVFDDNEITNTDIKCYFDKMGIKIELLENIEKMQSEISTLNFGINSLNERLNKQNENLLEFIDEYNDRMKKKLDVLEMEKDELWKKVSEQEEKIQKIRHFFPIRIWCKLTKNGI